MSKTPTSTPAPCLKGVNNTNDNTDLLKFPCDFAIKVMGKATEDFDLLVVEIVRRHNLKENAVTMRSSSGGKYLSVTVSFIAQSRTQLDALYTEMSGHERVAMVL
jgi:putative lipoic acid-binding regulatory protein